MSPGCARPCCRQFYRREMTRHRITPRSAGNSFRSSPGRGRSVSTILSSAAMAIGLSVVTPGVSAASSPAGPPPPVMRSAPPTCVGVNELRYVDLQAFFVELDSCSARNLADNLDNGKDAAGIAGGLAAKSWEAGALAAALSAGLWYNQSAVEDCVRSAAGRGISFAVAAGFVVRCKPQ